MVAKKYITMVKWNEKEIVDDIVSKYNKNVIAEKYRNVKKEYLYEHLYKRSKICFAIAAYVYNLPNFNGRVIRQEICRYSSSLPSDAPKNAKVLIKRLTLYLPELPARSPFY